MMKNSPPKSDHNSWLEWVILLGISLLYLCYNHFMLVESRYILQGDAAEHALKSLRAFAFLKELKIPQFCWGNALYPPLMYQISALEYFFIKPGMVNVSLSQFPYWAVLIFALYGIGKRLFSSLTGYLGVFYFLTIPLTIWWSYQYMLDLPASAMTVLTFYVMLKTEKFKNPLYSWLFGVVLAAGMLTKWWVGYLLLAPMIYFLFNLLFSYFKNHGLRLVSFLLLGGLLGVFIKVAYRFEGGLAPMWFRDFWAFAGLILLEGVILWLAFYYWFAWAEKLGATKPESRQPMMNFLGAMTLTYVLCAWLYLNPNFALLNGTLFSIGTVGTGEVGTILPWPSWEYYPAALWQAALRAVYLPLLLIGLLVFGLQRRKDFYARIYLLTVLSSFALLVIMPNKQERYLLPWLALASPLAVFWFDYFKKFKIIPILGLFFMGLLYAFCSFPPLAGVCRDNRCLAWLLNGNPPLTDIREKIAIEEGWVRKFLAPLPQKGEKVLVFVQIGYPAGNNLINMPVKFWGINLDLTERNRLGEYQYIIYGLNTGETKSRLMQNLKSEMPYLEGAGDYEFLVLSRCPFPQEGFELFLARVVHK